MNARLLQFLAGTLLTGMPLLAQPVISGLSPQSQLRGQSFSMTITGSNFCFGAQVNFNGVSLQSQFVNSSTLTVNVDGNLTSGGYGLVPVRVINTSSFTFCSNVGTSNALDFDILLPPFNIVTTTIPEAVLNTPYSTFITATGGLSPYVISLTGQLPTGITFNTQSGLLAGTPTQTGSFPITVRFTDSREQTRTQNYTLIVRGPANPLTLTTSFLPNATLNTFYSTPLTATGGTTPYSWSLLGGAPNGLTIASSTGVLSGTPTQSGSFNVQIRLSDAANGSINRNLTLVVQAPTLQILTTSLPIVTAGTFYSTTLSATGGTPSYSWSTSSSLPLGLSLQSNGTISGTTQQSGSFPITVLVRDSANQTQSTTLTLVVGSTLQITTLTLPQAFLGQFYSTTISATGGTPGYHWNAPGGLPPGLSLDSLSGILTGTPSQEGSFSFNIQVVDSTNQTTLRAFQLVVGNALTITNSGLKTGTAGLNYEDIFTVLGGVAPYTWAALVAPPPGLTLNPTTGVLNGVPTLSGNFNLTVRVTDTLGATATRSFSIGINPAFRITTTALNTPVLGTFFEQFLTAEGGTAPYFWSFTGSALPGLTLNSSTGSLSGIPTQGGVFTVTVFVNDSLGQQTSKSFTVTINQTVRIAPESIPTGTVGVAYTQTFSASGGVAPYSFSSTGFVPGLLLDPTTGVLSGTPTQAGTFELVIRATDIAQQQGVRNYTLVIQSNLQITTSSLPDGVERSSYGQTLSATGGTQPLSWRISAGTLPEGLTLNATGSIIGTPVRAGTSSFTVEVTDSANLKATKSLSILISPGVAVQTAGTLTSGIVGSSYGTLLNATGGTPPFTWRVSAGQLPDGLTLDTTGQISGTPTRVGRFTATVEATDSANRSGSAEIIINITPTLLRITSSTTLPDATAGVNVQFTPAATGGTPPYRWALNGAPSELSINETTGAISGRILNPGSLSFGLRVTDSNQVTATQTVSLRVVLPAAPTVNITGLPATGAAGQQATPRVAIAQAYPVPLTGELTLVFNSAVNADDPAIQFSTGGRRVAFNIPAGQTDAVFNANTIGIQTGTVAGTIVVTARISAAGTDITPTPAPSFSIQIARAVPVINSLRVNRTANGFELVITAYATSRELTSASVRLTTSGTVQGTDFTVNLAPVVGPWYQGANSVQFGSLCAITIPFTIQQGTSGQITSVSVTLTNAVGASAAATANF